MKVLPYGARVAQNLELSGRTTSIIVRFKSCEQDHRLSEQVQAIGNPGRPFRKHLNQDFRRRRRGSCQRIDDFFQGSPSPDFFGSSLGDVD